jgi:hypothetical protein
MIKLKYVAKHLFAVAVASGLLCVSSVYSVQLTDNEILSMVDVTITPLPEKMSTIPPEMKRVAFSSLKVDRNNVSLALAKQIQGKIEAKVASAGKITVIYAPEIKPIKVSASEGSITLSSGFQTTDEIKQIADKLRLDGLMEGEFYLTQDTLYMNLRIIDSRTMAIVWSQEFKSIIPAPPPPPPAPPAPPPLPVKKYTGVDYGFGVLALQMTAVPGAATINPPVQDPPATGVTVPSYAKFYSLDMRLSEKTIFSDKVRLTMTAGLLSLMNGLDSNDSLGITVLNTSVSGRILATIFSRIGARISLIPRKVEDERVANPFIQPRDILAAELNIGKIWLGGSGVTTAGIRFESDITRVISVGFGFSYAGKKDLVIAKNDRKVTVGGTYYEVSLLRFNFMP